MQQAKREIIQHLQRDVLSMQRPQKVSGNKPTIGLADIENAFPDQIFPVGAIHEFISNSKESAAATNGFMAGMMAQINKNGTAVWVSSKQTIFPPALSFFGIEPDRVIFIDLSREKDVLWAIEEVLKCSAVSMVIGELSEITFTESRRLQLAVEQSRVTGFIHRNRPKAENITACISRWKVDPLTSHANKSPGIGFPCWNVQLVKVRNGRPNGWQIEWAKGKFRSVTRQVFSVSEIQKRKAG